MNTYKVKYKHAKRERDIEADDYKIEEGFLTFCIHKTNVGNIDASLVEYIRLDNGKELSEEEIKEQFQEKFSA